MASNGILHVLNAVMIPPAGTIVSTLAACPVFKTLVEAVKVAGLVDTLSSPGPFTLFAPTDKAFDKLPPGTLEKLLKHPTELASEFDHQGYRIRMYITLSIMSNAPSKSHISGKMFITFLE